MNRSGARGEVGQQSASRSAWASQSGGFGSSGEINLTTAFSLGIPGGPEMNAKTKSVIERIKRIEEAIIKGREYLESGAHANWRGFRPLFNAKVRNGKAMPPHRDWVKNVFLPRKERALRYAEKVLRALERKVGERAGDE
jgi:hypothetical protein